MVVVNKRLGAAKIFRIILIISHGNHERTKVLDIWTLITIHKLLHSHDKCKITYFVTSESTRVKQKEFTISKCLGFFNHDVSECPELSLWP